MKPSTRAGIDTLVWVLIYGGLFVLGLGVALSRGGLDAGWSVSVVGIVVAVAGVGADLRPLADDRPLRRLSRLPSHSSRRAP